MAPKRIFLIGLSGSGKSTTGRLLAGLLGWEFVDSDRFIEAETGRSIPDLFREEGEAAFRSREASALAELATREHVVIATGGGAPTDSRSCAALTRGLVAWLDITPEGAARRLQADAATEHRPLLEGDLLSRLTALADSRLPAYQRSDHSIAVDYYTPAQVAERLAALVQQATAEAWHPAPGRFDAPPPSQAGQAAIRVTTAMAGHSYPIVIEEGSLGRIGALARDVGVTGRAFVITDTNARRFAEIAASSLSSSGYAAEVFAVNPGEENKTVATLNTIYDWLIAARIERRDFLVCVGGGVVTDMGGFAAASVLRGIDFIHVPTTMLAMTDAAIGGKTGIDHPLGKNLIGAFAQPRAVLIDPAVLATLSERQRRNGWAEVIKHGFILDAALVAELEGRATDPGAMMAADLISRSVAIKATIVSEDEREAGRRTLLNYGHTLGHAIEAVTGYGEYLHGEAVAIGMHAAGLMAVELRRLAPAALARQQALLRAYGLPERAPGLDIEAILEATLQDKKVRSGAVQWVLLESIGRAVIHGPIDPAVVRRAVEEVTR